MLVSIIIPCYNSEQTISKVVKLTKKEFEKMEGYECEFVLINDYSNDNTFLKIKELANSDKNIKGIDLSKNFGQHNAIMAGLNYADGDYIMGMDDDMQTHPSQIVKFIKKIEEGYDIVYGKYPIKKHSLFRNLGSKFNDFTVRKLIGKPKGLTACSFWICKKYVRNEIINYHNFNAHIQGLFLRTTKNITNVDIEHFEREVGESNYTLKKLIKLWAGCLNFSILPLRFSIFLGFFSCLIGFIALIIVIMKKIINPTITSGWSSIMCAIFIFSGIILLVLGILGEYIGRVLLCINNTPQFIIKDSINIMEK